MFKIDPQKIKHEVEQEIGLSDWGNTNLDIALNKLCSTANAEPLIVGPLKDMFIANLKRQMSNRLKLYNDRKQYPEISAQKIKAPLIVIGLPRSGTTILHGILAQDPVVRSPRTWEVAQPSPPPSANTYTTDPRIAQTETALEMLDPTFRAMHSVGAEMPEECNAFTVMALLSPNLPASLPLRPYAEWLFREADMRPAYQLHKQVLQHFQAFAPGAYWVLKSPPHLFWLETLLETYPVARIIVTHRDPAQVLPSNASLIAFLLNQTLGNIDKKQVGKEQNSDWALAVERLMAFRAEDKNPERFVDVHYTDLIKEPMSVIERIYTHFDMPLTAEARTAMSGFLANNRQGKHGKHDYTAEEFGMNKEILHEQFSSYINHYSIAT